MRKSKKAFPLYDITIFVLKNSKQEINKLLLKTATNEFLLGFSARWNPPPSFADRQRRLRELTKTPKWKA